MISQGCAHARIGDVIEPAALHRSVAYREFFSSVKFRISPYFLDLKSTIIIVRCMYLYFELMFQAGVYTVCAIETVTITFRSVANGVSFPFNGTERNVIVTVSMAHTVLE